MENIRKISTNDSNLNMNVNLLQAAGYIDDLEGIVTNEPLKNKYETVKFHKLNTFPYFLIGKVVSKFDFDGTSKYLNGVGILIGPDTVLTVAHNLCHMSYAPNGSKKISVTKKVCFFAAANGDFSPFGAVKSLDVYIPPQYTNSLETDNKEEQLYNDWGLVYLSAPVGEQIISILDVEKTNYIKIENSGTNKFYNFFANNENLNLSKLSKQTKTQKISIVGYTEYKDNYRNNSAYKFLNNFSNSSPTENSERNSNKNISNNFYTNGFYSTQKLNNFVQNNLSANQGKIISEIDREILKSNINTDKKININININTETTEGLLANQRYYSNLQRSSNSSGIPNLNNNYESTTNGVDYIILNNEELNKDFDYNDVDKLIMSESKGKLINHEGSTEEGGDTTQEDLIKAIKYQISTYKGQSGSPIFLRIKKITDKNKSKKSSYFYQFIGLHSRRGPIAGDLKFYESEKMNVLTENIMTKSINNNMPLIQASEKNDTNLVTLENNLLSQNESKLNNEIIKQNGMCEYNIALSIIGDSIKQIKKLTKNVFNFDGLSLNTSVEGSYEEEKEKIKSDFVLTKIYLNNVVQLSGLFRKNVTLSVIFAFGAKIFNVPKEYILLKDINNTEFSRIHNYNFDSNKKYTEVMSDPESSQTMEFELMLNIKKYGNFMSNNILQKFMENYDLEENQLKKDFEKKYMKHLFQSIFAEINYFENNQPTYGKLFKKIRKNILKSIGLCAKKE